MTDHDGRRVLEQAIARHARRREKLREERARLHEELGELARQARDHGMSLYEVARRAGVSRRAVYDALEE